MQVWSANDVVERVKFIRAGSQGITGSTGMPSLFGDFHVDSTTIDDMLHNSPEDDLPSVLDRMPSEMEFLNHAASGFLQPMKSIKRSKTPTPHRDINPRQRQPPPPPDLSKQYTSTVANAPPGVAGHRDLRRQLPNQNPALEAQRKADVNDAPPPPKPVLIKKLSSLPLTFSKLPESSYIDSVSDVGAPSLLMQVLKGERQLTSTRAGVSQKKPTGKPIDITVYLPLPPVESPTHSSPKPRPVNMRVPRSDTCQEVISKLLSQKFARKHLCSYDFPVKPKDFVLKLHDEDGLPMDGFDRPLGADNTIEEINDDDFCLCVVKTRKEVAAPTVGTTGVFKVHLPHSDVNMTSFNVRKYTCLAEVLRKHLLHQDHVNVGQEYDFYLLEADQKRLRRKSGRLNPNLPLSSMVKQLQIEEVEVRTRVYRDIPTGADNSEEDTTSGHNRAGSRSTFLLDPDTPAVRKQKTHTRQRTWQLSDFIFDSYEAYALKSWKVIKVNQRGRQQERIIAVDEKYIYNRKIRSGKQQNRNKRLISDIIRLEYQFDESDPSRFRLVFRENTGEVTVNYIAQNPRHAAEIVAKIRYIMDRLT